MNNKLIDEYVENVTQVVPPERREDVKKDMKLRIMEKAIDVASERKCTVSDDIIADVLKQWPPYLPLKAVPTAPAKVMKPMGMRKVLLSLAGLVLAFIVLDVVFLLLVPDSAGVPKADVSTVIVAVAFALITAILVIGVIFAFMYGYNKVIRKTRVDPVDRVEKVAKGSASPVRVGALTLVTLAWMVVLYLWWRDVTIPAFDTAGTVISFFSEDFASFVPLILAMGVAMIVVNVLYIFVSAKWIVSLAETVVNAGVMLVFYLMIQVFPFNAAFSETIKTGIYLMLCLVFLVLAVGVAKNILQTMRFMNYGNGSRVHPEGNNL